MAKFSKSELARGVLEGDRRAIAQMLTLAERGDLDVRPLLSAMRGSGVDCHVIGVTGPPGSGKSTLVGRLAEEYRRRGRTVGAILVDPSSPVSGGALLGDRIRMSTVTKDPDVFVRSMATRGTKGALAAGVEDGIAILAASGKQVVIVETVGAGQNELEIVGAVETVVLVHVPGLGDALQSEKAGLIELAQVHVVNKSDQAGADRLAAELEEMLEFRARSQCGSRPAVIRTVATDNRGIDELADIVAACHDADNRNSPKDRLESLVLARIRSSIEEQTRSYFADGRGNSQQMLRAFADGQLSMAEATKLVLREIVDGL